MLCRPRRKLGWQRCDVGEHSRARAVPQHPAALAYRQLKIATTFFGKVRPVAESVAAASRALAAINWAPCQGR
jgi:hypothetical protein